MLYPACSISQTKLSIFSFITRSKFQNHPLNINTESVTNFNPYVKGIQYYAMKKTLLIAILFFCRFVAIFAQSNSANTDHDFYNMSLEDLMNIKVSVASVKALTARESPGIITLITEDEIRSSGARDLMDLLNTIPGFEFGTDVQGVIGLGVRGNWAHEGKFLLLIDGLEMNENLFSSVQFGNHYPVEHIRQIEIIRGPGSAMYGGFAEYAVINIITRQGEDLNGLSWSGNSSATSKGISGIRSGLSIGKKINDFSFSINSYAGSIRRSDQEYSDLDGNSFAMYSNSEIKNYTTNAGFAYKKFHLRILTDQYQLQTRDNYTTISSKPYLETFDSYFIEVKKELALHKKISIYPKVSYKKQTPWSYTGKSENEEMELFKVVSEKWNGGLNLNYNPTTQISFSSGVDVACISATDKIEGSAFRNGKTEIKYFNTAVFLQALFQMGFADFTVGTRYNYNELFNPSFVPRIGITKVFKHLHFKCLYSHAFRTPGTENINLGVDIQPEKTSVFEIEGGLQISENMFVTLNAFRIRTNNTIVYYYDDYNESDAYKNYHGSGTEGVELVYKLKNKWGWVEVNYGFYHAKNNFKLDNYIVSGHPDILLGFPAHKLCAKGTFKIWKSLSVAPVAIFRSEKFDYRGTTSDGTDLIKRYPSTLIADFSINYENLFLKGLHAGIGVYNILNTRQDYIQPYNSLHAPIPGQSREFAIKLRYDLSF